MRVRAVVGAALLAATVVALAPGGQGAAQPGPASPAVEESQSSAAPRSQSPIRPRNFVPAVTRTVEVTAEKVVTAVPTPGGGCYGGVWAVVADRPNASFYTLTYTSTVAPGLEYTTVFNRHERQIGGGWLPADLTVGGQQIATRFVANSTSGNCVGFEGVLAERFSIERVVVTELVINKPDARQAGYSVIMEPTPPAGDGPSGKDACTLHRFVSVPRLPGVNAYEIRVASRIFGGVRLDKIRLDSDEFDPTTPNAPGVGDYSVPGRLGHYLGPFTFPGTWGCRYAAQQWLASARVPSIARVELFVDYTRCRSARPTIIATGPVTIGTSGDDVILGRTGADEIDGKGGNDRICGRGGNDMLRGGPGRDLVDGGPGRDTCVAGPRGTELSDPDGASFFACEVERPD